MVDKSKNYVFRPSGTTPPEVLDFLAEATTKTSFPKLVENLCMEKINGDLGTSSGSISIDTDSVKKDIQVAIKQSFDGIDELIDADKIAQALYEKQANQWEQQNNLLDKINQACSHINEELANIAELMKKKPTVSDSAPVDTKSNENIERKLSALSDQLDKISSSFNALNTNDEGTTARLTKINEKINKLGKYFQAQQEIQNNHNGDMSTALNKLNVLAQQQDRLADLIIEYSDNIIAQESRRNKHLSALVTRAVYEGIYKYVEDNIAQDATKRAYRLRQQSPHNQSYMRQDYEDDMPRINNAISRANQYIDEEEQSFMDELSTDDLELFLGMETSNSDSLERTRRNNITREDVAPSKRAPSSFSANKKNDDKNSARKMSKPARPSSNSYDIDGFAFEEEKRNNPKRNDKPAQPKSNAKNLSKLNDDEYDFLNKLLNDTDDNNDPYQTPDTDNDIDSFIAGIVNDK